MADGIAVPGRRHLRGMLLVHAHAADLMIDLIDHSDPVALLEYLEPVAREHEGQPVGPALVARIVKAESRLRLLAAFAHRRGGFGFENGIFVIADELGLNAETLRCAREIDQRGRA